MVTSTQSPPKRDIKTLTAGQIEGPYWKPLLPERSNLREPDTTGEPITSNGPWTTSLASRLTARG